MRKNVAIGRKLEYFAGFSRFMEQEYRQLAFYEVNRLALPRMLVRQRKRMEALQNDHVVKG